MKMTSLVYFSLLIVTCFVRASPVFAGFYTTVEIRQTYEDNVAGLVTDNPNTGIADGNATTQGPQPTDDSGGHSGPGAPAVIREQGPGGGEDDLPPGDPAITSGATGTAGGGTARKDSDFSTEFYADFGYLNKIDAGASLFVQASFQHTSYAEFNQFDFTIITVSGGVKHRLSDIISTRFSLDVKSKDYDNPLRSGTALGAKVSLLEKFGPVFWAREFYGYELNNADSEIYSYKGHTLGIRAGLDFTTFWTVEAGYSYLRRRYDEPSGYEVTSSTISAALTRRLGNNWSIITGIDQETSTENFFNTSSTNNMFSAALQYLY